MASCSGFNNEKVNTWTGRVPDSPEVERSSYIYRSYYETEEDMQMAVDWTIQWLQDNGYVIVKICAEYGRDMTYKEELKFIVIVYKKENKND